MKKRNPSLSTVAGVVSSNTGMGIEELLNDTKEYRIDGIGKAADMIREAVAAKQGIYIAGDYDTDGIMASAVMKLAIRGIGGLSAVRLPRRFTEGYGLKARTVEEFMDGHLLVTVDNGITAHEAVRRAREKGMKILVTDHHLPSTDAGGSPEYPEADLIIDPKAVPGSADFDGYCGAGIALRIAEELLGKGHQLYKKCLSFAAVATVADSMPLTHENRRIVRKGLKSLLTTEGTTKGMYALLCELGLDGHVDETDIGFKLAPVLNAPGRLYDNGAEKAMALVMFEGEFRKAALMAKELAGYNAARKELSDRWYLQARGDVERNGMRDDYPIVLYEAGMPEGIIGIAAGRIAEEFGRPCFLLGDGAEEGVMKGSGRSDGHADLKACLDACSGCLLGYGGHAAAAGVQVEKGGNLDRFREAANLYFTDKRPGMGPAEAYYDLDLEPGGITRAMTEVLKYAPYGEGNPSPVFRIEGLSLTKRPYDDSHYRLIGGGRGVKLACGCADAVSFNGAEEYLAMGAPERVDLTGTLSQNHYMGRTRIQIEYGTVKEHEGRPEPADGGARGRAGLRRKGGNI